MRVKREGKKYSIWAVTLVGAIALLSTLTTTVAVAVPDPEFTAAHQLEDRVEELKAAGKYNEAIGLAQRALAIWEKVLGKEHQHVATSLSALALLYTEQGNYTQAEPLIKRALAIREKVSMGDLDVARSLRQLASLYQAQGKYDLVEPLIQRSITILEKVYGKENRDVARSLGNLALFYQDQGNYTQAELLYQRSLAIFAKLKAQEDSGAVVNLNLDLKDIDALNKATILSNLATLYLAQGKYSQAESLLKNVLTMRENKPEPNSLDIANSLNSLGALYRSQGELSQAEPLLKRALSLVESRGKENIYSTFVLNNLALVYQAQGKYDQAEPLLQRTLALREKVLGQEHPDVASSFSNLASLYQAQGNTNLALEFRSRSNNIAEHNLALILTTGSEPQKRNYLAILSSATNATISLHVQSAPTNPQAARLALTTILQRKGRVLDALTDSLQAVRGRLNPQDRGVLDELATTRSELAALTFKGAGNIPIDEFRKQITTLSEQEQKLEDAISRRSAEFRTQNEPVTIEAVQKLIPADAALVELVLYKPFNPKATKDSDLFGTPRYVAYILQSQGEPKSVDIGDAATIDKAVTGFRKTIRLKSGSQTPFKTAARTLDTMLMQPIRKQLGNKRNILLSPDSQLNLIPFAALIDEQNHYLLENYEITYLSSGRDLIRLKADVPSKENPVIVANPLFDEPGSPPAVRVASSTRGNSNQTSADLASLKYGSIEGTATEAKAIATILPNAKLLTGSNATENALKQLNAPNILHIATHGFFLEDSPPEQAGSDKAPVVKSDNPLLRSGLALAGFNLRKSGNEDGVLTALEVAGLDLAGTKLVVLSACETGLGDVANGEGVYGLRRALSISGAESQLITLWLVDDEATKDLMVAYYQRLQKNIGRSAALRQVQLEMLKNPQYQRPYYWAAFIPSGEWRSLEVRP